MSTGKPNYNFSHPVFKMRKYIRWAIEHIEMWELAQESDVISWEVKETETPLNIPTVYTIEYRIRSIIGIDENEAPVYGENHILELAMPNGYPAQPCTLYMRTNVWHPNVKSDGEFKGRVCGNVQNFGLGYTLSQLVLRIGEILQYKNYHADFIPPYPEDTKVAEWVKEIAEPREIINLRRHIFVDNTPLLRISPILAINNQVAEEQVPVQQEDAKRNPDPTPLVDAATNEKTVDLSTTDTPTHGDIASEPAPTDLPEQVKTPKFVIQPKKIIIKPK